MSMDTNGKIIWAKHSEIQQANLKAMGDAEIKDGERLPLAVKDMGSCEIYPQTIQHNPNGRYVRSCAAAGESPLAELCVTVLSSPGSWWCVAMASTSSTPPWL